MCAGPVCVTVVLCCNVCSASISRVSGICGVSGCCLGEVCGDTSDDVVTDAVHEELSDRDDRDERECKALSNASISTKTCRRLRWVTNVSLLAINLPLRLAESSGLASK
jgi:hypothetical protein